MAAAVRLARRPVADRSIRILVSPTPVTFTERRSVLQVLEQYGQVEVFQMTPVSEFNAQRAPSDGDGQSDHFTQGYHANFISLTNEASTATKLVSCSPLNYQAPGPQVHPDIHVADLANFNGIAVHGRPRSSGDATSEGKPSPSSCAKEGRNFTLEIFPAPDYEHRHAMAGSLLQHSWPEFYRKDRSFAVTALEQSLPRTIAAEGLAHWHSAGDTKPKIQGKADRLQVKSWLPSKMKG